MAHRVGFSSPPFDYRAMFESAPELYLVLDTNFNVVAATDLYLKTTAGKRDEIQGRNLFDLAQKNSHVLSASLRTSLEKVIKSKKRDVMPIFKFGEKQWRIRNLPIIGNDDQVKYIVHYEEDVSDLMNPENKETDKDSEKLRQSQRMEAMGQLAGGVAHDFNNMLAVIIMNCEVMLGSDGLGEGARKGFEQIKRTGERAAALTRQLLSFSRKHVLQPRALNLNTVISETENMLRHLLKEDISITTSLSKDLGNTMADPGQIEQIILNLVVNARDAMPKGGAIAIETSNTFLDENSSKGNPRAEPGPYVLLAIRDSGEGMHPETLGRIFEPFFTTKGEGKGTGLGLATVYGIVTQNKGTIWVHSELGRGTVFKIFLPLVQDAIQIQVKTEMKPDQPLQGTQTILVVEDQEELRELICDILKANGYKVLEAENGKKALEVVSKNIGGIELIITDVVMPEMGGRALAKHLAELKKEIKLLYLSGYSGDTLADYDISETHPHFLEKPFTRMALLQKIKTIFSR